MKILILGAGGMLGHKLYQTLSTEYSDIIASFRKPAEHYHKFNLFNEKHMIGNIDVTQTENLLVFLDQHKPDVICNCIGKTTRKISSEDSDQVIFLNSYLPHLLNKWSVKNNSYLVHFSTDCVFSGGNGPYKPFDFCDSRDLYGLSKILGETSTKNSLTLRTSIVGREIENKTEFFEWIFSSEGKTINGYKNVFYSGVTTLYLSEIVAKLLRRKTKLLGLQQIASPVISKFDLIAKVNSIFKLGLKIVPNYEKVSHKGLDGTQFRLSSGLKTQSWDEMLANLKNQNNFYINLNSKKSGDKAA